MIYGIGTDIVHIPRIEKLIEEFGEAFLNKTFTSREITYAAQKSKGDKKIFASTLAKRWAAKEAVVKALGTGFGNGLFWRDIEVLSTGGLPSIVMHSTNLDFLSLTYHISLSDDYPSAIAYALVTKPE